MKVSALLVSHRLLGWLGPLGLTSAYDGGLKVALEGLAVNLMLPRIGTEDRHAVRVMVGIHMPGGLSVLG